MLGGETDGCVLGGAPDDCRKSSGGAAAGPPGRGVAPGVITRQKNPDNLEYPFWALDKFLTPNEQFYVRNHFEVPTLWSETWRLRVEGSVERPLEIGYDELLKLPSHTMPALLECSGNGRVFLESPPVGIQWELGGVGTAEWTGPLLSDVLDRAGVKAGAVEVILEGADAGELKPPEVPTHAAIRYARSLPLEKARRPEVLLAYKMNGEDLPPAHGFPVRAVVAGWYGMASVKWLTRVVVTDVTFHGYFQTFQYAIWKREHGQRTLVPVTETQVKAEIARPTGGEAVPAGKPYRVYGAAWAGEADVTGVEVSTDGGKTWSDARLSGEAKPFCWRFWEYEWKSPAAGKATLLARAADSKGRTQPVERDEDRRETVITHALPVEVEVR